ncbi:MAG: hypothetical protein RLZZ432_681 [Chloroflexota bacterium]|jgi:protein-tyrosine phosphatase
MIAVLALCHGNICRSPLAEVLLEAAVAAAPDLAGRVTVTSAGTSGEHEGEGMHAESAALLRARGLRTAHRARRLTPEIAAGQALILAADRHNLRAAERLLGTLAPETAPALRLLRDFDAHAAGGDLDDPWGHPRSAYVRAAREIEAAIPGILDELRSLLAARAAREG